MNREVVFQGDAFEYFTDWVRLDRKLYSKIVALIKNVDRSPFSGLGKPEPLKHELHGYWSHRIDDGHRLVGKTIDTEIIIVSCRYHYG